MKLPGQILLLSFLLIAIHQSVFGVQAYPYPVNITQPDGTFITIIHKGDEHNKSTQTVDGYSILRNRTGIYEYAILDSKNDLTPSGIKARNPQERNSSEKQFLNKTQKGLSYSRSQMNILKSISMMYQVNSQKAFPTSGSRKLVCILIGFTDKSFSKTKTDFEDLFNQVGYSADGASGSVNDYYSENSWGQLDLTVTVAGPYTAANNMAYYGANDSNGDDANPRALITEAVTLADPDVNYSDFDNDADGTVDGIYVIYAGYGEEYSGVSSDAIWAHAWAISPVYLDGERVSNYSCSAELRGNSGTGICRIGVICHEFGHVLGASDFYDTDYNTNGQYEGTGNWDLMSGGSWNNSGITPAHHNPYTKIYVYGWASATTITSGADITLNNAEQNSDSFYRVNTPTPNEYFLIENRQKQLFDLSIPGHGMVIYHVDENYINTAGNSINTTSHQGMYPICAIAPGNPPTEYGNINSSGLPFPGSGNRTAFTDDTTPYTLSWAGAPTNKPVTGVTENTSEKTISFSFMGGASNTAPVASAGTDQIINEGEIVTLNASYSADPEDNTITFQWTAPPGIALSSTTAVSPEFTAPEVNEDTDYAFSLVVNDGFLDSTPDEVVVTVRNLLKANILVDLEGSYNQSTGLMNTTLSSVIPLAQPFLSAPWNYPGTESVASVPADIVDWVFVELRQATAPESATSATILAQRAAFLKDDGSIVDMDGTSTLDFGNYTVTSGNNVYAALYHRNHLSVLSASGMDLQNGIYSYNFTTGIDQAYGGAAGYKQIAPGVFGMVSGDVDADGSVSVLDFTGWATDFGQTGAYSSSDLDEDSQVTVLDFTRWATNFGVEGNALLKGASVKQKQPKYTSQIP
ncbi:MAG: M6 family metalloprotease domain-containing protein [Prolixibacteraceae bacterium]